MNEIPAHLKQLLLNDANTSRCNKIHLATGWQHFRSYFIEWKWQGVQHKSRLMFRFSLDEEFVEAKSFEEDTLVKLEDCRKKKQ